MGKASRAKRERREQADFTARLTACEGTWLEQRPTPEEQARIAAARKQLEQYRSVANAMSRDPETLTRRGVEVFRAAHFTPLHFDDWVIEQVFDELGEPPVSEDPNDTAFSDYLRAAVETVATARVRRAMADQVRRFLPQYVEAGLIEESLVIEQNAYLTVMSSMVTPLLAQMMVGGLARWYDEHEEETETEHEAENEEQPA
jgi:hypothetical protein